jgi:hypothetical protein
MSSPASAINSAEAHMTITRRDFLATTGIAAAAPFVLGTTDKSGSKTPVLGERDHQYEAIHDWGQLPPNLKYGNTHGVCQDSQGHIYIHHTVHSTSESPDTIVVFDENGKFVRSWGKQFKGGAHGLMLRQEGSEEFLYLCDYSHAIVTKRTLKGEELFTLGYPVESPDYDPSRNNGRVLYQPTNVAIAPNGDIYIADGYGSSYINQYTKGAQFIRTFGGHGNGPGQLDCPHGIWVDTRAETPVLVVADRSNHRLQRFTLDGKHIDFILDTTKLPCHFHERNGEVVLPDLWSKVVVLDRNNKVIATLGDAGYTQEDWMKVRAQDRATFPPGKFICPHSACFDHAGNIFVVEWVEIGRVTKLRKIA